MLEFLNFKEFFFSKFLPTRTETKKMGDGRRERRKKYFFFGKITHVFGTYPPVKKRLGNPFLKDFVILRENFFSKKFLCDERRERQKEGTIGTRE
jgi:hypothetical protein